MILVTGGTGIVGSHLLYKLINEGAKVRATYRREKTLKRTKHVFSYFSDNAEALFNAIEWIKADINDIPKLSTAFKGITHVYHCAAFVSFEPDKYHQLRKINIEGTANIVNLCISNSIKKLCYVSSIAALGHNENPEKSITEDTPWNPDEDHSDYAITKYGAELEVWRGSQEGINVVVVNPGIILGAGFWNGGSSGSLFKKVYKGLSYYTKGITGYVDVWDVVNPMVTLMQSNIINQGYILVSENVSYKSFLQNVAKSLDVALPNKEAKVWLLKLVWRIDWLSHKLLRKKRSLSKHAVKSLSSVSKYDNLKIRETINYNFTSINKSIQTICSLYKKDLYF